MSYIIEPISVFSFVTDPSIKLPRFQRKATWTKEQNFELAISIFQDYPVGVVIVNKEKDESWLLDGRQRRTALIEMRENPIILYDWAKKYIGFKANEDPSELRKNYWGKVDKYLQKEDTNEKDSSAGIYEGEEELEDSFDSEKQKEGLQILLDLILMVHQIKNGASRWERDFNFTDFFYKIEYVNQREDNKINPVKLRKFLLDFKEDLKNKPVTKENFTEYYLDKFAIRDNQETKFREEINHKWNDIYFAIETISKSEKIFIDARIGLIKLTNVSPLDAQNIFSRINRGGTLLKAEELLSAKPFWNAKVNNANTKLKDIVKTMYERIGVEIPKDIYRWDIAATLLQRINDKGLFFDSYKGSAENGKVDIEQITLGFKLISSVFERGMSGKHVNNLEKNTNINWETSIDYLIEDIDKICEILMKDSFFEFFQSWKKPLAKLMGNAIVLEFITIVLEDWKDLGKPTVSSNAYNRFKQHARILFDRLVYEYSTKMWRGSGDSKMAADINNWKERIKPVSQETWLEFISAACNGKYKGENVTQQILTPVLYYYYILTDRSPINALNTQFEVDHLYPQEKFKDNCMVDISNKDCLCNLSLLPKKENVSKNNKSLREIVDTWLIQQIATYADIQQHDFEKYSDLSNIEELKSHRKTLYEKAFKEIRDSKLAN
ncbi:MAG: DUF262 domain-containing protein [Rikenellaceae bacterium]|nr:DUF262 domain-containing protein [Rikenellaceae bacterium]